jgi:glycosyltransferase involved in cell wall biosynthesis
MNGQTDNAAIPVDPLERKLLSVVIPAHNEAPGIAHALGQIRAVLCSLDLAWELILIDDGSRDGTFARVVELGREDPRIKAVRLSRNFGKEAALLAGLEASRGDAVVTMDADLQHPPELIPEMIRKWEEGAKVVNAVKRSRERDSLIARMRARMFNALLSELGGINVKNSSDFKLLDRVVIDVITKQLPERQRFYRGLSDWVGYVHANISFDVASRAGGEGKWTFRSLLGLATTAIVSFTSAPLRIVTIMGLMTMVFGFLVASEALIGWFQGHAVSGFTTIIITLLILGSFIMISLGIIGEYIAKMYDEIKRRPAYLIEESLNIADELQPLTPPHPSPPPPGGRES